MTPTLQQIYRDAHSTYKPSLFLSNNALDGGIAACKCKRKRNTNKSIFRSIPNQEQLSLSELF